VYADGVVSYWGAAGGGNGQEVEQGNKRMNHAVAVAGLTPGETYAVWVASTEATGMTAESATVTVRLPQVLNTAA